LGDKNIQNRVYCGGKRGKQVNKVNKGKQVKVDSDALQDDRILVFIDEENHKQHRVINWAIGG
jgi:hypothetical protein